MCNKYLKCWAGIEKQSESRGRNYEKYSDLGEKILVVSNVSSSISNEFLWLPIFILEVYILILNLNLTTRCVGIVVRTLDCHQGDPSSNPSTAKPFCEKLCLENSLKIWLSQI